MMQSFFDLIPVRFGEPTPHHSDGLSQNEYYFASVLRHPWQKCTLTPNAR
jgi:hypothetical protein